MMSEDVDVDHLMFLQVSVNDLGAEITDLRKAIENAELMFRRFKGKQITGTDAATMMRASIETTLRVRAQRSTG
jgi:hypothetical protein